ALAVLSGQTEPVDEAPGIEVGVRADPREKVTEPSDLDAARGGPMLRAAKSECRIPGGRQGRVEGRVEAATARRADGVGRRGLLEQEPELAAPAVGRDRVEGPLPERVAECASGGGLDPELEARGIA